MYCYLVQDKIQKLFWFGGGVSALLSLYRFLNDDDIAKLESNLGEKIKLNKMPKALRHECIIDKNRCEEKLSLLFKKPIPTTKGNYYEFIITLFIHAYGIIHNSYSIATFNI